MKKITFSVILSAIIIFVATLAVAPVNAQLKSGEDQGFGRFLKGTFGGTYATEAKLETALPAAVGQIISVFLGLIGVVLLVIVVYAGFLWLTAGGNEDQVGKAKKLIKNGVIGLIIALGAFVITSFVVQQIQQAVGGGGIEAPPTGPPAGQI